MSKVVIVEALRTPIGTFGGMFRDMLPTELLTPVLVSIVEKGRIEKGDVQEVIIGQCIQRTDEPNTARTALLKAGFPFETTGYTVQRQCGSGLQAIIDGLLQIENGVHHTVIAGGVEAMSSSPYIVKSNRWGAKMRHETLYDSVWEVLEDPISHKLMGVTAENVARKYEISREEQDNLAYESHQKALTAINGGYFFDEVIAISDLTKDEQPRTNISLDKLASLETVFEKEGTVTAGNSSSLNDGAAAVLLMSAEMATKKGIAPLAEIKGFAIAGVDPDMMGIGPVPAIQQGLKKVGWSIEEVDLFEINEAFAAQYLAVEKELNLPREKVNVNGSGISLGHPVGCTGARIVTTLVHELKRRSGKKGIASLCVGGGMGVAIFIEMV
ncbi:acetyl-CoA acetyltransferase [Lottiidibacillus patelloidae]|uniref:acetyl-CoA C-acetyltransferase n=1 Tax=Lottiidibacillus patelloidae TaxID=2670334 RepID=A0A263BWV7_9BACI|nr:thiolase family protein [Lottiidibacillus patelloidae]OZM58205.1 acetyl-CoA acetyltransferase [Lottiidibacillus patelloidae]